MTTVSDLAGELPNDQSNEEPREVLPKFLEGHSLDLPFSLSIKGFPNNFAVRIDVSKLSFMSFNCAQAMYKSLAGAAASHLPNSFSVTVDQTHQTIFF